MKLVFDVEANGLNEVVIAKEAIPEGDRVWCLCLMNIDTGETWSFKENAIKNGVEMLRNADLIIGHNVLMFDIPFLQRYYGEIKTEVYDTLIVSRLMYPDRQNHPFGGNSLKKWGEYLGCEKIDYTGGWDEYSDEMIEYCLQDVVVTERIYRKQQKYIEQYPKSVKLEHMVAKIISTQIENGFGFNLKEADLLERDLLMEKVKIEDQMSTIFPPITEERYSEKTGKRLKDNITYFNPGSRKQIADRLKEKYNWIPPLTDKGNPKVDSAVLKKLNYPEAKTLVKYFDIIKLLGMVSDWIQRATISRDNKIHGFVNTQGTVTGRMTASQPNLQQVSGDPRARALFIPRKDWVEVGIDASGLEARLLANRMAKWDNGEYGKSVVNDDIHTVNKNAAGLQTRTQAKTFFYALIYGAGDMKIGMIVGKKTKEGKKIKKKFFEEMPALKNVIDNCGIQITKKGTITLLDGREVPCRSKHKALNVQIQGDGAIIMKLAQCIFYNKIMSLFPNKVRLMATVHDEWQIECDPVYADQIGKIGIESIKDAGKRLGCIVPMDGEYHVGKNWAECH